MDFLCLSVGALFSFPSSLAILVRSARSRSGSAGGSRLVGTSSLDSEWQEELLEASLESEASCSTSAPAVLWR